MVKLPAIKKIIIIYDNLMTEPLIMVNNNQHIDNLEIEINQESQNHISDIGYLFPNVKELLIVGEPLIDIYKFKSLKLLEISKLRKTINNTDKIVEACKISNSLKIIYFEVCNNVDSFIENMRKYGSRCYYKKHIALTYVIKDTEYYISEDNKKYAKYIKCLIYDNNINRDLVISNFCNCSLLKIDINLCRNIIIEKCNILTHLYIKFHQRTNNVFIRLNNLVNLSVFQICLPKKISDKTKPMNIKIEYVEFTTRIKPIIYYDL